MAKVQDKCLSIFNTEDMQVKLFFYKTDLVDRVRFPLSIKHSEKERSDCTYTLNFTLHLSTRGVRQVMTTVRI